MSNFVLLFQLFKELQGVQDNQRQVYLELALQGGQAAATEKVKKDKKRSKLRKAFIEITKCEKWEIAEKIYKEHTDRIDEFLGNYIRYLMYLCPRR